MMSTSSIARPAATIRGLWLSLRPHQWIKNLLVFSGLIFSRSLLQSGAILVSVLAFLAFCMASSAIYQINDLRDLEADRIHPVKRFRPLAAGRVSPLAGLLLSLALFAGTVAIASTLRLQFCIVLGSYVGFNLLYSFGLKRVVILDVMIVAMGFVLRAVAGAFAIGVQASPWLLLCTLMLALFVGFSKRRNELHGLNDEAGTHRVTLDSYTIAGLDSMMDISAAAALVTYALYTTAAETVARVGSGNLLLTVPFVLFGLFRYLHLVQRGVEAGDPALLFLRDQPLLLDGVLWITTVCLVIYLPWDGF